MTKEVVIEVEDLTKVYGDLVAVDHVSFTVGRGEVFAFLGPNGAGKTTTIEILQCLRRLTSGSAKVLGYDVTDSGDAREIKKCIGVLPQEFNALDKLTVRENIAMFAAMYDDPRDPDELIRLLDLEDKRDIRFDKLSGGLKQRVGVAASLVNDPEIVFLDEPTTGLDPRSRREVWQVIEGLKEENRVVFLTSHYMEEAERLADRIAILVQGSIAAIGRTTELLRKYGGERMLLVEDVVPELVDRVKGKLPEASRLNGDMAIPVQDLKEIGQTIEVLDRFGVTGKGVRIRSPTIETVFLQLVGARITREGELA